jgi:hypothetical protein
MKKVYSLVSALCLIFAFGPLAAQTIWTGPKITITKAGGADWTLEENQDRITDNVWITRANNKGLFNIAVNDAFIGDGSDPANYGPSPAGTEWAFGSTADGVETLEFTTWIVATTVNDQYNEANPPTLLNQDMVLHLIEDDIYMDIKLLSWGVGNMGQGSFSYERASDDVTSIAEVEAAEKVKLSVFPNPSSDFLSVQNLKKAEQVMILNAVGKVVYNGVMNPGDQMDISALPAGMYLLRTAGNQTASFIKK